MGDTWISWYSASAWPPGIRTGWGINREHRASGSEESLTSNATSFVPGELAKASIVHIAPSDSMTIIILKHTTFDSGPTYRSLNPHPKKDLVWNHAWWEAQITAARVPGIRAGQQTMTSIDWHCTGPPGLVNLWLERSPGLVPGDLAKAKIVHIALNHPMTIIFQ